jgi:hypothetical protein
MWIDTSTKITQNWENKNPITNTNTTNNVQSMHLNQTIQDWTFWHNRLLILYARAWRRTFPRL